MGFIAISGKIGSGKDLIGKIIQYHVTRIESGYTYPCTEKDYNDFCKSTHINKSNWKIVKFADALKDIVCILTGCTREQLEDIDFKNSKLPDEWIRYGYVDGFIKKYIGNGEMGTPIMNNKQCSKEKYKEELRINWQTAYKYHLTYRELLQYLGTDLLRNQLHEDVWVNALFSKYKKQGYCEGRCERSIENDTPEHSCISSEYCYNSKYPNWIITDCRFENEAKAVKDRGGIVIRVERFDDSDMQATHRNQHPSETALDNYKFDYVINNDGSIEDLIIKVKEILIKEKII